MFFYETYKKYHKFFIIFTGVIQFKNEPKFIIAPLYLFKNLCENITVSGCLLFFYQFYPSSKKTKKIFIQKIFSKGFIIYYKYIIIIKEHKKLYQIQRKKCVKSPKKFQHFLFKFLI